MNCRNDCTGLVEGHDDQLGGWLCISRSNFGAGNPITPEVSHVPSMRCLNMPKGTPFVTRVRLFPGVIESRYRLQIGCHLAGEHFDEAGAVHADGLALVGDRLQFTNCRVRLWLLSC